MLHEGSTVLVSVSEELQLVHCVLLQDIKLCKFHPVGTENYGYVPKFTIGTGVYIILGNTHCQCKHIGNVIY